MPKQISTIEQAFLDLYRVQNVLAISAAHDRSISKDDARELAETLKRATETVQRTINHAKRALENGVSDEGE